MKLKERVRGLADRRTKSDYFTGYIAGLKEGKRENDRQSWTYIIICCFLAFLAVNSAVYSMALEDNLKTANHCLEVQYSQHRDFTEDMSSAYKCDAYVSHIADH